GYDRHLDLPSFPTRRSSDLQVEVEVTETPVTAPESEVQEADDSDDLIDDEILEIFIEEAGEVLDTIREYLPMLLRQHDDRSALRSEEHTSELQSRENLVCRL